MKTLTLTPTQQRQLDFLRRQESDEDFGWEYNYDVSCKDCDEHERFHAACSGIRFIHSHAGHRTWVKDLGKVNPLVSR